MMSSVLMPTATVPTKKAATKPSAPMFTGSTVAARNMTASAIIGINSVDIEISGSVQQSANWLDSRRRAN